MATLWGPLKTTAFIVLPDMIARCRLEKDLVGEEVL